MATKKGQYISINRKNYLQYFVLVMAGKVLNIKVCSPLKLRDDLTGNYHAICHYLYNLPLAATIRNESEMRNYHKN